MTELKKRYKPFLIEPTKRNRLIAVLQERLEEHAISFAVTLKNGRQLNTADIAEVMALDNSSRSRVQRLILRWTHVLDAQSFVKIDIDGRTPNKSAIDIEVSGK